MNLSWTVRTVASLVMILIAAGSLSPYIHLAKLLPRLESDVPQFDPEFDGTFPRTFDWLGILSGFLTVVSLTVMVGLDCLKQGILTSTIVVGFVCSTVALWSFWIATAVFTVQASHIFAFCHNQVETIAETLDDDTFDPFCGQVHAAEGLSIVMCILLPLYPLALVIAIHATRNKAMSVSRI